MQFKYIKPPYQWKKIENLGLNNDLFILNKEFFVKKSKLISHKFLNLENQLNVTRLVQFKGYTLPIFETKIDNKHLWVLMPYYQDTFTYTKYRHYPDLLLEIAQLVKLLHGTPVDKNNNIIKWNALEQLDLYCNLVNVPKNITVIKEDLIKWLKNYQPKTITLCHNDLTGDNFILANKRWYIIDWDFACLNDRLFDIASFVSETLKKATDISHWYQLFNINQEELKIINYWIKYQNLIWYHWAWYLYKQTKNKTYKKIADDKLEKLGL